MLAQDQKVLDENTFLQDRKNNKELIKQKKAKRIKIILSIFLSLILIVIVYFLLDISNIKEIKVEGNIYLKDEDIISLSELSLEDKFLLVFTGKVKNKVETNELIEECNVSKQKGRVVCLKVKEKKILGYAYESQDNVLILQDDSRYVLDKNSIYLIEYVPLIEGFSADKIVLIEKNLVDIDYKMINEISEIHYYPELKYQDHMIIMRDGNYVFTSVYGLNILNKYYDIVSSYGKKEHKCYYFEDISGNAYTSACPWVINTSKTEENIEQ